MTGDCGLRVRPETVGLQGKAVLGVNRFLGAALEMGCGSVVEAVSNSKATELQVRSPLHNSLEASCIWEFRS